MRRTHRSRAVRGGPRAARCRSDRPAACRRSGCGRPACPRAPCWPRPGRTRPARGRPDASRRSTSPARMARVLPPAGVNFASSADDQLLAAQIGDVVLRHVVAERPHQLGDRHLGAGRHPAIARRVELEEPALTRRVLDGESRRHAVALRRAHRPRAGGRAVGACRARARCPSARQRPSARRGW